MCEPGSEAGAKEVWRRIFIARPFDETSQLLFDESIAPALAAIPLVPIHMSSCGRDHVVERVAASIAGSGAVLAVLIGQNRNVFIEVGIAIALRKPLLLLVENLRDCGMLIEKYPIVFKQNLVALPQALTNLTRDRNN
jgi:hypothetical protein